VRGPHARRPASSRSEQPRNGIAPPVCLHRWGDSAAGRSTGSMPRVAPDPCAGCSLQLHRPRAVSILPWHRCQWRIRNVPRLPTGALPEESGSRLACDRKGAVASDPQGPENGKSRHRGGYRCSHTDNPAGPGKGGQLAPTGRDSQRANSLRIQPESVNTQVRSTKHEFLAPSSRLFNEAWNLEPGTSNEFSVPQYPPTAKVGRPPRPGGRCLDRSCRAHGWWRPCCRRAAGARPCPDRRSP